MPVPSPLQIAWTLPDGSVGGFAQKGTFKLRGALPGASVLPTKTKKRGRTLLVEAWTQVSPSPAQIPHPCAYSPRCGGCDLGDLAAVERQAQLTTMVKRALRTDLSPTWIPSVRTTGHRARIRLGIGGDQLGYHPHRSNDLVPIEDCLAARPEIRAVLPSLAACLPSQARVVEIRTDGHRTVFCVEGGRPKEFEPLENVAINGRRAHGDPTLTLTVAGLSLRASPRSFFQVNLETNERLVTVVTDAIRRLQPERVLDLYAGIGNLSLPIAALGIPTVAVELEGQATEDLKHNAALHQLPVTVIPLPVERFDPYQSPCDLVVLDPPRAGAPGIIDKLLLLRPKAFIYVSCHIPSAARDIQVALQQGYRITEVTLVDLFPGTHHIETVLVVERIECSSPARSRR